MVTERLALRPFLLRDAPEIYRLNGNPEVMRYLGKREVYDTTEQALEFLEGYLQKTRALPYARWAILRKSDGAWLGWCGLKLHEDGETDLGFRLHQQYWGQGFATEAGRAWLERGFKEFKLPKIVAQTTSENVGSQRVITKLGFHRTPTLDHDEGEFRWWHYALMRSQYA
ncbi:MAG: GNAT family N-acetyltransferase [Bacteroidota bacterium]